MKRLSTLFNFAGGAAVALLVITQLGFKNSPNGEKKDNPDDKISNVEWRAPKIPDQLTFADEEVPLGRWEVKERFERELLINSFNQDNILYLMKLSHRYFPAISERLAANGVPDDFKYLCIAESNLQSGAVSRAGAVGFWQFMGTTAPGYGLEANKLVDERMDVVKSTDAAAKYLKNAYQKFGNWTAAAASFNCGQGGYNGQATYQGSKNYYDLQLPEETNRYIFRILAFKHILENTEALGFKMAEEEKYNEIPHRIVQVTSTIPNLATFAREQGTTYKMIRVMNPWIRGRSLPVRSGDAYQIKLPAQPS